MKVKEVIEVLEKFNQNYEVVIRGCWPSGMDRYKEINSIEQEPKQKIVIFWQGEITGHIV